MAIPNQTHQALSNVFAALTKYVAVFSTAAGVTGANEASGSPYVRVLAGTPTPDGIGDNTWAQIEVSIPAGTYTEGGFFSTLAATYLAVPTGLTVTAHSGGSLTSGTTYYYKITGYNWAGETLPSSEVSFTPSGSNLSVTLNWSALLGVSDQAGVAGYLCGFNIYRGLSAGAESTLVAQVAANATSYVDTGSAGTTQSLPTSNTALTFLGSNEFDGGTITVTGGGGVINIDPSVTV